MQTLQLSNEKALQLYPTASPEWKLILEQSFPKGFFNQKITDRVKTFEDACAVNGTDPKQNKFTEGEPDSIAFEKLKEIAKALREGKELSYKNSNQAKWYPIHEQSASGFRFRVSYFALTSTVAPARLAVDSEEKSNYFGKQFNDLFEQYKN